MTAEDLMRSRYTAFATSNAEYIRASWDPATRPATLALPPIDHWVSLTIVDTVDGGALAAEGTVEFEAVYESAGGPGRLHERSNFRRHEGRWVYVGGIVG